METPKHGTADRLLIAEVSGALTKLAGKVRDGQLTQDQAVAELHAITRDPHLLGHGLGGCLGEPGRWDPTTMVMRLAVAAGVDLTEAAATYTEMHPPGRRGMRLGRSEA